jgi:hypothetical protein
VVLFGRETLPFLKAGRIRPEGECRLELARRRQHCIDRAVFMINVRNNNMVIKHCLLVTWLHNISVVDVLGLKASEPLFTLIRRIQLSIHFCLSKCEHHLLKKNKKKLFS